ncbi:MAG TPA: M56 family metallopeptidase [Vicinamibacterales bacterium]|nr:M56 family metallopeptidase [Vicinamibacterales bacterium]
MLITALDVSLRIIAAAAAVGLVLVVLRVRSGAARHAAWSAVLVAMLLMPLLTAIVPKVDVPVPAALALDLGTGPSETPEYSFAPAESPVGSQMPVATVPTAENPRGERRDSFPVNRSSIAAFQQQITSLLVLIYVAGGIFFAVRMAGGWRLARRLVAGTTPVDIANSARVLESPVIATPLTTGVMSPTVLLPITWREWPADKLAAVLAHENAHIVRRDALVAFLAQVNRAIFWFHPLAWWLERTLAVAAEHACDETAARQIGQPRRYAEVLLDMAEAVSVRGQRVSWQTIGVDGSGLLGARIDRILKGDAMERMSRAKRVGVALGCASVLVLAIACRQQIQAEPLRPDPEVQKQIDENKARSERHKAAVAMTADEAAALEKTLESSPDNVDAREKLIIFYDQAGKVSWEEKLAGIRRHALWRLQHLPETDLWIPNISKRYDPEGYAEAKRLWVEHTSKPDVTAKTLGRAAAFLSAYDKADAEELLLRAQQKDPEGPWTRRLGDLYALAIVGNIDPRYGTTDRSEAQSPFATEARRKLEQASDAKLLAAAGLTMIRSSQGDSELGRQCLERAAALDPQNADAQRALADLRNRERHKAIRARITAALGGAAPDTSTDATYAAIATLSDEDRLFYLPGTAAGAYMGAEYFEYTAREKPEPERSEMQKRAAAGFARARQYAEDALALAERHRQTPDYGDILYSAHTTLAVLALRDGDRRAALTHMSSAAAAPPADKAEYMPHFGMRTRLVEYLLREGERESVAQYVEKSAERFPQERERLLTEAKQIRDGVMPMAYQYAEARR